MIVISTNFVIFAVIMIIHPLTPNLCRDESDQSCFKASLQLKLQKMSIAGNDLNS